MSESEPVPGYDSEPAQGRSQGSGQSFCKSLFVGNLREDLIFPYLRLGRAERERTTELCAQLGAFARDHIDSRQIDRDEKLPVEVLDGLRRLGLFGLAIPSAYGGLGLGAAASCRLLDALGAADTSCALTVFAHSALSAHSIVRFGSDDQQRRYLPRLASGEWLGSFAVTEAQSGSDAAAIRSRAERVEGGFLLNGTKLWVQNGRLAKLHVLFAQSSVLRDGQTLDRISAFLVEDGPGVRAGVEQGKLGARGSSNAALYIEDLRLSPQQLLGPLGSGFKVLMETLNYGRLGFAASCLGTTRMLLRLAVQHATSRHQFGRLLSTLGLIKDKLAGIAVELYAAESMVYLTAGLFDANDRGRAIDCSIETACAKVLASETAWRAANEAAQIAGACGYSRDYPYERYLRDCRLFSIFPGGTNEVLRCYIALNGLAGPGEQHDRLADAIKYPLRGYGLVVDTLMEKVRSVAYGRALLGRHHPRLKKEAVLIEDAAEALGREVDRVLRRHGRLIPEMQYVQRRLADIVIDLFAMCATVARASTALYDSDARGGVPEAGGELDRGDRELRLCAGFCSRANTRIAQTLAHFSQNDDELFKAIADDCCHAPADPADPLL